MPAPLPWQSELWSKLQEARAADRLAHSLLLAGPEGVGKRDFARALAASLLCESPRPGGDACGACRGCTQMRAGSHPNLFWIRREINEKTDKEKRDISMEQLRAVMDRLSLSSHYGHARVVVIDPAEALNVSGVNALLKTIEEPQPGNHVVLISERPMSLAPTLRSRCQRIRFPVPPRDAAIAWLRAADASLDAASLLDAAAGAPLRALEGGRSKFFEQVAGWRRTLLDLAQHRADPVSAAGKVAKESAAEWLRAFTGLLHDVLRARVGVPRDAEAGGLADRLTPGDVEALLAETVEGQRRLQFGASPQFVIESLMIGWWHRARPSDARSQGRSRA